MCDYSLHAYRSRPAKVGDKLVTRGGGLFDAAVDTYAPSSMQTAVCLLPGTEVAFDQPCDPGNRYNYPYESFEPPKVLHSVGIFRKVDEKNPTTHHDALEFPDGTVAKIFNFKPEQRATVLQLPVLEAEQNKEARTAERTEGLNIDSGPREREEISV